MRILFVAQRVPYPPNRGDKIPNYHYIRHLSQNHEVSVACLAEGRKDLENAAGLARLVSAVEAVPLSPARGRLRALAALATGARPLTVAYFDEPELHRRVGNMIADDGYDLAVVCSSGVAQYVERFDLPRIIQFTDLDSQKWALYAKTNRFPKSWIYRTEAKRLLGYERHIAQTFNCSLFCSARELRDFRRLVPGRPAGCIRNGVDLDYFRPAEGPRDAAGLVFTGVMNYRPNVDGVVWFCRMVLPLIRAQVPAATFTICGASPNREVRKLARLLGVTVTGAVSDVRPYLARASVGVVPVRIARGIQNKLLEAMAMGLPTVATTAARAGLETDDGRDLFVADEPADFAAAVVRLLCDSRLRANMGRTARATAETLYRWDRSLAELDDVIAAVVGGLAFYGPGELSQESWSVGR